MYWTCQCQKVRGAEGRVQVTREELDSGETLVESEECSSQ